MSPIRFVFTVALVAALGACTGGATNGPDVLADPNDRLDDRDPREVERNREAMLELMGRDTHVERAQPEIPGELPPDLRVDVLDDDGQIVEADVTPDAAERSALQSVLDAGPAALLASVELEPVQGSRSGFRILGLHPGAEPLRDAGLLVGDVVRRVNGHDVLMPDGFMAAWESLADSEQIVVDIDRASEPLTLTIPVATAP